MPIQSYRDLDVWKAYLHFVTIALGSLAEIETQIEIARRLGMTDAPQLADIAKRTTSLRRMLYARKAALTRRLGSRNAG